MQLICTIVCLDVTSSSNRDLHYPQWIPPGLSTSSLTNGFHPESIELHCDPSEVGLVLRHLWHCLASLAAISHPTFSFKPEVPANARAWPIHSSPQLLWLHSFFPPPDQLLRQMLFFHHQFEVPSWQINSLCPLSPHHAMQSQSTVIVIAPLWKCMKSWWSSDFFCQLLTVRDKQTAFSEAEETKPIPPNPSYSFQGNWGFQKGR